MIVSHDTAFRCGVRTLFITSPKNLVRYRGNLSEFVAKVPAAAAVLSARGIVYADMPSQAPGRLEGINSTTKAILKLDGATFTWPGQDQPTLVDASCKLTLGSRVVVLGQNGAGKSTLLNWW